MIHNEIQPLAFRLTSQSGLRRRLWTMQFPSAWRETLLNLMRQGTSNDRFTVPLRSLRAALWMLVPDLIFVERTKQALNGERWLYASSPIDTRALWNLVSAWVQTDFGKADSGPRDHALSALRRDELVWTANDIDVARWTESPNGTAAPIEEDSWLMLPDVVAATLEGNELSLGSESPRELVRCPVNRGAQLVSWPPYSYRPKKGPPAFFSVIVTITAQTVPFESEPLVYVHMGLRRWVSWAGKAGRVWIPQTARVLMRSRAAWLPDSNPSRGFQYGTIRRYGSDFRWTDPLPRLLDKLSMSPAMPVAERLAADPARFLNPTGESSFAIVQRAKIEPRHPVGSGVNPPDRYALQALMSRVLADFAEPIDPLRRQRYSSKAARVRKRDLDENRAMLAAATGGHLSLQVLRQEEGTPARIEAAVTRLIGEPDAKKRNVWLWSSPPELRIKWSAEDLGQLGALDVPKRSHDKIEGAISARCETISKRFGFSTEITATVVELQPANEWDPATDPKFANRVGLARLQRLTQFITPGERSQEHRADAALRDLLFRQLGAVGDLRHVVPRGSKLPEEIEYVAAWVIRRQRNYYQGREAVCLPMMVRISSNSPVVLAATIGPDRESTGWTPYPKALAMLASRDLYRRGLAVSQAEVGRFIDAAIQSLEGKDTILLTLAQNLRSLWCLRNQDLPPVQISDTPGLRHIRVRNADQEEAPQYFAGGGTSASIATGLWRFGPRVFGSTGDKPASQANLVLRQSKVDRPRMQSWIPRVLELTVVSCQPGDVDWELAATAHRLRSSAAHYAEVLGLPIPLHLARTMEEYALPMPGSEVEAEVEDEGGPVQAGAIEEDDR